MRAVLTFHGVDERPGALSFAPRQFDALLCALAANDIPVLDLPALLASPTRHGVALTFDDGLRSVFTAALPLLRQHRAPAHLFLCTAILDGDISPLRGGGGDLLTWDMVADLPANGVSVECHTHRHVDLRTLADADIDRDCAEAERLIERATGRKPRYFAYPFGRYDRRVASRIGARYAAAFTTHLAFLSGDDDRACLPRLDAHYLRTPLIQRNLATPWGRAYLRLRRVLRQIRGTD